MATTSRMVLAGLCRRRQPWHRAQHNASALLLAQSPRRDRRTASASATASSSSAAAPRQSSRRPEDDDRQKWRQQRRHLSDRLKRRAIEALKPKEDSNADAVPPSDEIRSRPERGVGNFENVVGGVGGAAEDDEAADAPAAAASPRDGGASVEKIDPTPIPEKKDPAAGAESDAAAAAPEGADARPAAADDRADDPPHANAAAADDDPPHADGNPNPWAAVHIHEFAPKIVVVGVGGAGTNAVNNMVASGLAGVDFLALNTDAQHLSTSLSPTRLQIGTHLTSGLGCGANPDAGRLAAEESSEAIQSCIEDAHMVFITAGMGGGTGTGAAPVVAGLCYDLGILTVSVVTTPFRFEGTHRRRLALEGVDRLKEVSDTLIVVPNQNLFRLVGEKTSFVDSFRLADDVLLAGVRSITDLMTSPGLINLDFADVQSVMHGMGNALLGTGQACHDDDVGSRGVGEAAGGKEGARRAADEDEGRSAERKEGDDGCRAVRAAKMALNNPLLGEGNMDVGSAKGMLVNMTGGSDMTLYEVDRAAEYITERVLDPDANIIFGSAYDSNLTGCVRVSVVATGIEENE